ncbi:MAG: hypothetical protein RML95_12135 [Anaerolineae bacterium]|nr:hypothetical protein [Anaerolineae bacterium]
MTRFSAGQLIYTRVEPPYSPARKTGYQTVCRTESRISADEAAAVEKRVQCFQGAPETVRYQFFTLETGKVVVTHSVNIETDPEITDQTKRKGVFLAHCLVFDPATFRLAHNDPFIILERFQGFVTSAQEMVERFGKAQANMPEAQFELDTTPRSRAPSDWSEEEERKLALLAAQPELLRQRSQTLCLVSSDFQAILDTLRLVFTYAPPEKRLLCSFDSCVDRCTVPLGLYWAVGASTRLNNTSYLEVNLAARKIVSMPASGINRNDLYSFWLDQIAQKGNLDQLDHAPIVQELAELFDRRKSATPQQLERLTSHEDALESFMAVHSERYQRDFGAALSRALSGSRSLSKHFLPYLEAHLALAERLVYAAAQQLPIQRLADWLRVWLEEPTRPADLHASDWQTLRGVAQRAKDPVLLFYAATLSGRIDHTARSQALSAMDDQQFDRILRVTSDTLPISAFVGRGDCLDRQMPHLIAHFEQRLDETTLLELVEALVEADAARHLDELTSYLNQLSPTALSRLEKLRKRVKMESPFWAQLAVLRDKSISNRSARLPCISLFQRSKKPNERPVEVDPGDSEPSQT